MGYPANNFTAIVMHVSLLWREVGTMWEFGYNNLVCKTMALHLPENYRTPDFLQVKGCIEFVQ